MSAPGGVSGEAARPRAAIVYNPTKVKAKRLRAMVEAMEAEKGWAPSLWAATTVEDPGHDAALRLLESAPAVVIAAGGDGTVSAVAQALTHQEVPLGILPTGTTNLFARALGLPLGVIGLPFVNARKALRAAFSETVRTVDVGRVDAVLESGETISRAFTVMAGMGVDAQMVVNTSPKGKDTLGWTGYVGAILDSFVRNRRFDLSYTLDGVALPETPAHTIVLGNAGVLPAGIRMIPGALIDDGLLDVVVLSPLGAGEWARAIHWFWRTNTTYLPRKPDARAAADGSAPVTTSSVRHARATGVTFAVTEAQDFEIDGEHLGRVLSATAWIEAGALRVRGSVGGVASSASSQPAAEASAASSRSGGTQPTSAE
ncbi:diacylglycerol/lipid kinase family protein [Subtercola boreus]|nr:diacylglycerol kinase family protein [Subtercola boreus]TQL55112.1 diacylglycerol kinase family enzyme [Subtercola boreus]